jgi:hypothetical protein
MKNLHLNSTLTSDDCMEWTKYIAQNGYGQAFFNGRVMPAHRAVYQDFFQVALTKEQHVCHKCDNRKCVNPEHLFVGSQKDNMQDCLRKGRHASMTKPNCYARGSRCGRSKLTDEQVSEIRKMLESGKTCSHIAQFFPITRSGISKIKNNKARKIYV